MRNFVAGMAMAALVAGCAPMDGMPKPVISTKDALGVVQQYRLDSVYAATHNGDGSLKDVALRTDYRDRLVAAYLMAADARYFDFRRSLSSDMKTTNIGYDFTILSLTGTASVWQSASRYLSAAATGIAGGRAAVNRELYYEKTLPALVAAMEAQRLQVRSEILGKLNQNEDHYPVEAALADLDRYQGAASLDGAIQQVTQYAAVAAAAGSATVDFTRAVTLCKADDSVSHLRGTLARGLLDRTTGMPVDSTAFVNVLKAIGDANPQPPADAKAAYADWQRINDHLRGICTAADWAAFSTKMSGK